MRYWPGILALGLSLAAGAPAAAEPRSESIRFHRLGNAEGLPHMTVFSVVQDRRGFLWFGTQNGIARYDGYSFRVFRNDLADPSSLSDNDAGGVYEDRAGFLWVRTWGGGLNRFDPQTERFTRFRHDPADPYSLSADRVQTILEDSRGGLWAGTFDAGLSRLESATGRFEHWRHDPNTPGSLSSNRVWCLLEDKQGNLWAGTDDGLNRYSRQKEAFEVFRSDPENPRTLSHSQVRTLMQDRSGVLWVGTTAGLNALDPSTGQVVRFPGPPEQGEGPSNEVINAIYEDRRGRVWVGTIDGGLNLFDPLLHRFEAYKNDPRDHRSLSNNDVRCILEDRSGTIWVGTRGGGVSQFDNNPRKFHLYQSDPSDPEGLRRNAVFAVLEDHEGVLWVGTWYGGLNRLDPETGRWTQYTHNPADPASLGSVDVNAILEDRTGVIWVGTWGGGLNRLDRGSGTFRRWRHDAKDPESLSHDNVLTIIEDGRSGLLWLGTREGGLNLFDPVSGRFQAWRNDPADPHSLSNDTVNALLEDRSGVLWVGTDSGLNKRQSDGNGFVRYVSDPQDPGSLGHNRVVSLHEDAAGTLWVGTRGGGLAALDRGSGKFKSFMEKDGLPSNTVYGILPDLAGNLWLSTDGGLSRFTPKTGSFRNYDVDDGLQANDFNAGAFHRGSAGQLYFGGQNGLNWFRPEEVKDNAHVPPVVLTGFNKFDKTVRFDRALFAVSSLELDHKENFFSFEFAALDTVNPRKNRYAYKLEGFDPDWIFCGNRRYASYTNLDGGDYVFRVKASNNDGIWNEEGASIHLRIVPAPWKTWWAYALYVLGLVGSVTAYVWLSTTAQAARLAAQAKELERQRLFVESLQRVDRLKDEFLANTSHELRTPLHGIIGISESLIAGAAGPIPATALSNLAMVVASGQRLSHLVNDILDLSKLKNSDLELTRQPVELRSVVDAVLRVCRPLVLGRQVDLRNEVGSGRQSVDADENRLQQILHNLVGNAIKFTESGSVTVTAETHGEQMEVSVADTGIGIPHDRLQDIFHPFEQVDGSIARNHSGTGLGLSITRQLVELHGGRLEVDSKLGSGSRFRFTLPLSREPVSAQAAGRAEPVRSEAEPEARLVPSEGVPANLDGTAILVVDDDPVNLQVLINVLSMEGYSVRPALHGPEALEALRSWKFQLVLIDVMMPGMSGYEVCRRLREQHSLFELPVLMLTAKDQPADIVAGLEAGANDYLAKPFARAELLARVKTLLQLRQAVGRALQAAEQASSERQQRLLAETFHGLTRALISTLDLSEVLERLLDSLGQVVPFDSAAVSLQEQDELRVVAIRGHDSSEHARRQHLALRDDEVYSETLRNRQACAFLDRPGQQRPRPYRVLEHVGAGLALPLISEGMVVGTVSLDRRSATPFAENEIAVALALCGEAGIAIHNARLYGEVRRMAITDGLTGLTNRQHFFVMAERELQRARRYNHPLSVLMLDIDHFKKFNDAFGHVVGDKVLRLVADTLRRSLRSVDVVARYGGEEFAVLLIETDVTLAETLAERLRRAVAEQPLITEEYGSLSVTASLGVAGLGPETPDLTSMVERADGALYQAKREGRDRVVVR